MEFVDLHTHSTASDGTKQPAELVQLAKACGLKGVALTDHDTVAGLDVATAAGDALGIPVVRGCELAARTPYGEAHFLGLWLPHELGSLPQVLAELRSKRAERNLHILERLREQGMAVTVEELLQEAHGESVGRPHIAAILLRKGYVRTRQEAFTRFLGQNGTAYVAREVLDPLEAVRLLREVGATVVLAHPCLLKCPTAWLEEFVHELRNAGLMALEAYHSEHNDAQTSWCVAMARRYELELSGGSDFHGDRKLGIQLGVGRGSLRVPAFVLDNLLEQRARLRLPI